MDELKWKYGNYSFTCDKCGKLVENELWETVGETKGDTFYYETTLRSPSSSKDYDLIKKWINDTEQSIKNAQVSKFDVFCPYCNRKQSWSDYSSLNSYQDMSIWIGGALGVITSAVPLVFLSEFGFTGPIFFVLFIILAIIFGIIWGLVLYHFKFKHLVKSLPITFYPIYPKQ